MAPHLTEYHHPLCLCAVGSPFLAFTDLTGSTSVAVSMSVNVAALLIGFHAVTKVVRTMIVQGGSHVSPLSKKNIPRAVDG